MKISGNQILWEEEPLDFIIKRRRQTKSLRLAFDLWGKQLTITTPFFASQRMIFGFLLRHEAWLKKQKAFLSLRAKRYHLHYGGYFPFLGRSYLLVHNPKQRRNFLWRPEDACFSFACEEAKIGYYLEKFLKKQAKNFIEKLVSNYSQALGVNYKKISYRDTKTRWGSCNHKGDLCFSWRIMMAPPEIISYLAAHEVAHLRELNHSAKFWQLCQNLCPKAKKHQNWLKIHGTSLKLYIFS